MKSFGTHVKNRRHDKRISMHTCAAYACISSEALRLIECGVTNPAKCKVSTLYGLAHVLGYEITELIQRAMAEDVESMRLLSERQKALERDRDENYRRYTKWASVRKVEV